jgi:hypothetical protein
MSWKKKYSRIVFKGVIKDYTSKFIKKEGISPKSYFVVNIYINSYNTRMTILRETYI